MQVNLGVIRSVNSGVLDLDGKTDVLSIVGYVAGNAMDVFLLVRMHLRLNALVTVT